MADDVKYINFPVSLLRGIFDNKRQTLSDIVRYSVYKHSKNNLDYGTEIEKMKNAADFFNLHFTHGDEPKNSENALKDAIEDGKRVENSMKVSSANCSLNLKIFWDFYEKEKSEFEIACFCAFCAIKSVIGNKEYAKSNKSLIISRMFGKSGKKDTTVPTAPKEYSDTLRGYAEASRYLKERHGNTAPSQTTVACAVKNGKLKSVECYDDTRNISFFSIDKSDLDVWFSEWANPVHPRQEMKPQSVALSASLEEKYSRRRQIDKVLRELQENHWGLKLYSDHSRGFYLSFTKELADLAEANLRAKLQTKDIERAENKRKAKEEALKRLNRK